MLKVITKMAARMPMLLERAGDCASAFGRYNHISTKEQISTMVKVTTATTFLRNRLMKKYVDTVATRLAAPYTTPLMKILS